MQDCRRVSTSWAPGGLRAPRAVRALPPRFFPLDEPAPVTGLQECCDHDAQHRDQRYRERHQIHLAIDTCHFSGRYVAAAREDVEIDERHEHRAADDRHAPERLHRRVHELAALGVDGLAALVHARHRFDRHRVGDRVLHDIAHRRKQRAQHIPRRDRHDRGHRVAVADQQHHDDAAHRDQGPRPR